MRQRVRAAPLGKTKKGLVKNQSFYLVRSLAIATHSVNRVRAGQPRDEQKKKDQIF